MMSHFDFKRQFTSISKGGGQEMTRADGYQVILHIRGEQSLERLPVWVYSSMSNQGVLDKIKSLGAEGLIAKGDYGALYKALQECLERGWE